MPAKAKGKANQPVSRRQSPSAATREKGRDSPLQQRHPKKVAVKKISFIRLKIKFVNAFGRKIRTCYLKCL